VRWYFFIRARPFDFSEGGWAILKKKFASILENSCTRPLPKKKITPPIEPKKHKKACYTEKRYIYTSLAKIKI